MVSTEIERKYQRIVVRMPNWLGDCVMATPVLRDLRTLFPTAKITAMCQHNVAPLLAYDVHIDAVMSFCRPNGWLHRKQHAAILEPLRCEQYDLGVLLTHSFSSAWWFWCAGIKERLGFATFMRSWLLTTAVPFPPLRDHQHLTLTYKALLEPLGKVPDTSNPQLYLREEEKEMGREFLLQCGWKEDEQRIVGINPGAAYGSAKCWPPERFVALTRCLLEQSDLFVVYFGDSLGKSLVDEVCAGFPDRVVNLAGRTSIRELMALTSLCHLLISNDSGPMHIGAALSTPILALFGSTSEVITGPRGVGPIRVLHKQVPCSPCYRRICPLDFRCMKELEVQEVYQAAMELLRR